MFIRIRHRGEAIYYQACESYRDDKGRPRQRVLVAWNDATGGPDVANAIAACKLGINAARKEVGHWRTILAEFTTEVAVRYWQRGAHPYNPMRGMHRNVCERRAAQAERRLARQEARLLALRKIAPSYS